MTDPNLRAADADRERAADALRTATAEGRLSAEELEGRVEAALSARTYGELDRLTADLPAPRRAEPRRGPRRRGPSLLGERTAFAGTALLLLVIWAVTGAGYFWPIWPILGWGMFVLGPGLPFGPCGRGRSASAGRRG